MNDMGKTFMTPIARKDVQKGPFFPSQPQRAKTRLSTDKAAGTLARGAYTGVREHDKGPRRPLADFFNILLEVYSQTDAPGMQRSVIRSLHHGLPIVGDRPRLIQLVYIGKIQSNRLGDRIATLQ